MDLYRLAYRSRPTFPIRTGWLVGKLRDIAMVGLTRNTEMELTGVLCIERNAFVQVLEGPSERLRAVYDRIILDKRHFAVEELCFEKIAERSYDDWAVAFAMPVKLPQEQRSVTDVYDLDAARLLERARLLRQTGVVAERSIGGQSIAS
ncbi:MAG: BLUF domain-containing protein [Oceanicaulis sp.]